MYERLLDVENSTPLKKQCCTITEKNHLQQRKDSVSYDQKWIVETTFFSMKIMFGEYVTAIRFENISRRKNFKSIIKVT
jgi:hypothetical protein